MLERVAIIAAEDAYGQLQGLSPEWVVTNDASPEAALERWSTNPEEMPDACLVDLASRGLSAVVSYLRAHRPSCASIGLYDAERAAIEAMRLGFVDCLRRGADAERLAATVASALRERRRHVSRALLMRLAEAVRDASGREAIEAAIEALLPGAGRTTWLVVEGRLLPGDRSYTISEETRSTLARRGRAAAAPPPGAHTAELLAVAADVHLVRAGSGLGAPGLAERLVATVLGRMAAAATSGSDDDQQMAELGRVARGLDHDLRNPLCALLLNVQLLQSSLPESDRRNHERTLSLQASAEKLQAIIERLSEVKRSLSLGRQETDAGRPVG